MTKRELVLQALRQEKVDRVPVGFWFHFAEDAEMGLAPIKPEIIEKNIQGHRQFIEEFRPDFVKLMSDGFFHYPNEAITNAESIQDLKELKSIGKDHPWFAQQVDLIKAQKAHFVEDIAAFYNIFAPATYLKWQLPGKESQFAEFIQADPQMTKEVLQVIAKDIAYLTTKILNETEIDGIYFSVQNVQEKAVTSELYRQVITPSDLTVLAAAESFGGVNILHICGYEGASNDLEIYQNYPAAAVNWAVGPEKFPLHDGQAYFEKAVIGGFENSKNGLLYRGSKAEIQAHVQSLLENSGRKGVIIGADCTVPGDISLKRLEWVRQAAAAVTV